MITLLILYFDQERSRGLTPEEIAEIKSKYIYFYPENSPNAIAWSPRHILNWSHFKAEPNYNSNNSAFIMWDIKAKPYCNTDNLVSVNSTAYMFQDKSWIKPNSTSDYQLKKHEQKHFDLSEVFARKMQDKTDSEILHEQIRCLNTTSIFTVPQEIQNKINIIENEQLKLLNKVQDRYDAETDNNKNSTMQVKWENMIGDWLDNRTNLDLYLKNFN